ncbi:7 transmembrane sweet-taste receptor of 3 GCPR-domain-containing protein [Blastocladiella britannica]|nr:7 transmembrane sweet-taste receptor of 3 GCPR-domain-containing protein [Blastocladiella britannica]
MSAGVAAVLFYHRHTPMIKASSATVAITMQLGFALVYAVPFLYMGVPSPLTCAAQPFFITVGVSAVMGLLLAKTWRIYVLFSQVFQVRKRVIARTVKAIGMGAILVNLVLCAIWIVIDPPVPMNQAISEGVTNYVCSSSSSFLFTSLLLAYNVTLILIGSVLGFLTRGVEERFNESKQSMPHITLGGYCITRTHT